MKIKRLTLILLFSLLLVACGGDATEEPPLQGNAENGERLFKQRVIGPASAPGCANCHSLEPDIVLIGPSQAGLGSRAGGRVDGQSAEDYIEESITNPDIFIVDGFPESTMYQSYGTELTAQEIADLVAFTMTQK